MQCLDMYLQMRFSSLLVWGYTNHWLIFCFQLLEIFWWTNRMIHPEHVYFSCLRLQIDFVCGELKIWFSFGCAMYIFIAPAVVSICAFSSVARTLINQLVWLWRCRQHWAIQTIVGGETHCLSRCVLLPDDMLSKLNVHMAWQVRCRIDLFQPKIQYAMFIVWTCANDIQDSRKLMHVSTLLVCKSYLNQTVQTNGTSVEKTMQELCLICLLVFFHQVWPPDEEDDIMLRPWRWNLREGAVREPTDDDVNLGQGKKKRDGMKRVQSMAEALTKASFVWQTWFDPQRGTSGIALKLLFVSLHIFFVVCLVF